MNGLEHPTRGAVRAWGEDLAGKRAAAAVKGRVGVVFQYPERQLFAPTVAEDVAFGPRNLGLSEDEVRARVERALRRVGLDASVAQANPLELSGGQQRRAALAGVLAMEPEVLVLDEPAAGLDPAGRRALIDLIRELHERGLTVVMVSHSMDDLAELCDRIVVLNDGSVALEGAPAEVFGHARELRSLGLGLPAAQHMARALAGRGVPLDLRRLYTVETLADALAPLLGAAPAAKSAAGGESR